MATFFRTKVVKNIGTTAIDALQTVDNNRFTIIGCNLANLIDDPVTIDIFVVDSTSTAGYYVKGIILAPNSSLKVITNGEKLILSEQCGLRIVSDTDNSIDAIISYAEIV
jgi:hypothetical protein